MLDVAIEKERRTTPRAMDNRNKNKNQVNKEDFLKTFFVKENTGLIGIYFPR